MTPRQRVTAMSGVIAAVASFVIWRAVGDSFVFVLAYAVVVGLLAAALSWWQYRARD